MGNRAGLLRVSKIMRRSKSFSSLSSSYIIISYNVGHVVTSDHIKTYK